MTEIDSLRVRLLERIGGYASCAVALSAGVDSAVVAKAAQLALGDQAVAVTGSSASLAQGELEQAVELARLIGIRHEIILTDELANREYTQNAPDRCFHCKTELYTEMEQVAQRLGLAVLVNGANADDLGDYRPGMIAAGEHSVASPLAECGITKDQVRQLAAAWGLPVWDKPATPCLSSRIAYGEEVTPERLAMIDAAERYLREEFGLREVRVRYHRGELARIEGPAEAIPRLCAGGSNARLVEHFRGLGFRFITVDLEGFRSGSLNELVPLEVRGQAANGDDRPHGGERNC